MKIINKEIAEINTPRVLINLDKLHSNLKMMQHYSESFKCKLRPHVKTHKCIDIAKMQMEFGASGITASKADEAIVFIKAGIKDVLIAYPLVDIQKIQKCIANAVESSCTLGFIVDSHDGMDILEKACSQYNYRCEVYLKIDVGLHRCGLEQGDPEILALADRIKDNKNLHLQGILSHAGHSYRAENLSQLEQIAKKEIEIVLKVKNDLEKNGNSNIKISIGATPTLLVGIDIHEIDEIRPGNYVFLDRTSLSLGLITKDQVSLTIIATVVSKNDDYVIIDAGSKVLSSDKGAHGTNRLESYGRIYPEHYFLNDEYLHELILLSEEHGFIKRDSYDFKIGEKVRIIPNHSCAVANLTDSYIVTRENKVISSWMVHARGKVL